MAEVWVWSWGYRPVIKLLALQARESEFKSQKHTWEIWEFWCSFVSPALGQQKQVDPWGLLASHTCPVGVFQWETVSQNQRLVPKEWHPRLSSGAHTCTYTCTHTRTFTHQKRKCESVVRLPINQGGLASQYSRIPLQTVEHAVWSVVSTSVKI